MDGPRASGPRDGGDFRFAEDEAIDVSRYRAALRRGVWLIVLIVVPLTVMVLVLSLVLPKTYESRATLVLEDQSTDLGSTDADSST